MVSARADVNGINEVFRVPGCGGRCSPGHFGVEHPIELGFDPEGGHGSFNLEPDQSNCRPSPVERSLPRGFPSCSPVTCCEAQRPGDPDFRDIMGCAGNACLTISIFSRFNDQILHYPGLEKIRASLPLRSPQAVRNSTRTLMGAKSTCD